ncbi:MAG: sulfur carrier protein ThiS [Planctomycetota bacterium]|jgi:sulfur carrier protein
MEPLHDNAQVLRVQVNGEEREFIAPLTVADLIEQLGLAGRPVAVERNKALVRKAEHAATALADGDRIEVVTFFGGG